LAGPMTGSGMTARIGMGIPHAAVIKLQVIRLYCGPMNGFLVDSVGMIGAVLTTVCWLPQAIQIVRSRDTAAISLSGTLAFTIGIAFWLIYGLALMDRTWSRWRLMSR
jgi:hypothetical protein